MSNGKKTGLLSFASLLDKKALQKRRLAMETMEIRALLATLHVDINDPGCANPGDNQYCEIQDAEDDAVSGDLISVKDGVYQPVVIDVDDITVEPASEDDQPLIDATGQTIGVAVRANDVSVSGLEVRNAVGQLAAGFVVAGDGNTLSDNVSRDNVFGYRLESANNNTLIGNIAENNFAIGYMVAFAIPPTTFPPSGSNNNSLIENIARDNNGPGILVQFSNDNTFTNNEVVRNQIGIVLINGNNNVLTRNGVAENPGTGIQVSGQGNTLTDNTAHENSVGIQIMGVGTTVTDNTARNNSAEGFRVLGDNNVLSENDAYGNGAEGIHLFFQANDNTLTGNRAWGNTEAGISVLFLRADDPYREQFIP